MLLNCQNIDRLTDFDANGDLNTSNLNEAIDLTIAGKAEKFVSYGILRGWM